MPLIVGEHSLQSRRVGRRDDFRAAHVPLPALRLARQDVPLERLRAQELARALSSRALRGAAVTLQPGMCPISCSRGLPAFTRFARFTPGLGARIVWSWLPSFCGSCSAAGDLHQLAHQAVENLAADFRVFSRPRKKIVALTLSPSERKRSMCFFLNW